ncbi:cell cycle checkpoint protein RAD17 isoform X2 [Lampris incognitus]|uniref:cell cycle checkpoint protein RAD17 isoform X2 n=1 Tax=Lampris incognitus TaxID=2546036 RepID=UPI0024B5F45C|nr:cell cycle checkpoint protein RAD17 isoform X2 [Lampris incognitus]
MSKFPRLGKRTSNEVKGWVEPSFKDSFGVTSLVRCELRGESISNAELCGSKQSRKRKGETSGLDSCAVALPQRDCNMPWVEKHAPSSQAELAVHKRKMEEVENWIRAHCDPKTSKGGAVLLLTGPPGCGKSATVQVLARELSFGLQEWTNPSTFTEHLNHDAFRQTFDPASSFGGFPGSSQTGLFQEFLLRANKYNCLQMAGEEGPKDRKVILVEDFPNQFYRQPRSLHDILRRFVRTGRCPLVFIVSDSLRGDSSSKLLFPREVQEELAICNISFNPVAPTTMMKILTRIATLEAGKSKGRICVPEKAALEQLCSGSSGDIRSAINSMQFSLIADLSLEREMWMRKKNRSATSLKKAVSKATQGTRQPKETKEWADGQAIGGKDASLFLFRALGKILHCKRESPDCTEGFQGQSLPAHLSEHHRNKLLVDPESVIERSHMCGEFFNLYLHQNYLDFFSEVEDVARASEYLSDADFLTGTWTPCGTMVHYGSSVATRGLLHCNNRQVSVGFRPLHKPNWLLVKKKPRLLLSRGWVISKRGSSLAGYSQRP